MESTFHVFLVLFDSNIANNPKTNVDSVDVHCVHSTHVIVGAFRQTNHPMGDYNYTLDFRYIYLYNRAIWQSHSSHTYGTSQQGPCYGKNERITLLFLRSPIDRNCLIFFLSASDHITKSRGKTLWLSHRMHKSLAYAIKDWCRWPPITIQTECTQFKVFFSKTPFSLSLLSDWLENFPTSYEWLTWIMNKNW